MLSFSLWFSLRFLFWCRSKRFFLLMWEIRLQPTCCSSAVISQTHASRASICRMRWDVRGVWLWVGERAVMLLYDTHGDTHMHTHTHADGRDGELSKESPPSQHPPYGRWLTAGRDRGVRVRACVRVRILTHYIDSARTGSRDKSSICISSLLPHRSQL